MAASIVHVSDSNACDLYSFSFQNFDEFVPWDEASSNERDFADIYRPWNARRTHFRVFAVQDGRLLATFLCGWCSAAGSGCHELLHCALRCWSKSIYTRPAWDERSTDDDTAGLDRGWSSSVEWGPAQQCCWRSDLWASAWFYVLAGSCPLWHMDSCNVHDNFSDVSHL